jgi:hypothetical protein
MPISLLIQVSNMYANGINTKANCAKGDPCSGTYVTDGNIGSAEQVCDIPDNHKTVSLCAGTGTFENEGPQFFSGPSCGFALSLNGQLYETAQKVSYDDSRCSGVCPDLVASVQGILLFTGLPAC